MDTACIDPRAFGAVPDGRSNNAAAFQRALDTCAAAGGGTVCVAPGTWLTGPLRLGNNTVLHLEAGARLLASADLDDYPIEGGGASGESARAGLITARGVENVAITGLGEIDGQGPAFVHADRRHEGGGGDPPYTRQQADYLHPRHGTAHDPFAHGERPGNLVRFYDCRKVRLDGVTVANSPTWTIHFRGCDDVLVRGLTIHSRASDRRVPNDDGIDVAASTHVRITECLIDTGDDCIAIFGSRHVAVANCHLYSRSSALRIGYDAGLTRDCTFLNLTIEAHRGVMVNVRAEGSVEDILISNVVMRTRLFTGGWWGHGEPVQISAVPGFRGRKLGRIRNVRISNLSADAESGIILWGCAESVLEGITLERVRLRLRGGPLQAVCGGNFDLRGTGDPALAVFAHDVPAVFFRWVKDLTIDGLSVDWDEAVPEFFSHAIEGENFDTVEIARLRGRQAHRDAATPAVALTCGRALTVRDCRAAEGTGTFLAQRQVADPCWFANNDLRAARDPGAVCGPLPSGAISVQSSG